MAEIAELLSSMSQTSAKRILLQAEDDECQTETEQSLASDFLITGLDNFPTLDTDKTETKGGLEFWILQLSFLKDLVFKYIFFHFVTL